MALAHLFLDPFFPDSDRAYDRALHNPHIVKARHAVDVLETPQAFQVVTDAPGFTPEDIKVELHDRKLMISGERQAEKKQDAADGRYHVQERHFTKFTRQLQLPNNIVEDGVAANLDRGVLTVTIPKKDEASSSEPKRIAVVAADS